MLFRSFGIDGTGWRLPNIDELSSIVELRCSNPSINLQLFHNISSDWFWSGSPLAEGSSYAWYVSFSHGHAYNYDRNGGYPRVRLVRGEQWLDPMGVIVKERKKLEEHAASKAEEERQRELRQQQAEEERRRKEEERKVRIVELLKAEDAAAVFCVDKVVCDKVFSLTQIYLNQNADMKIQVATDTIVETYNPAEDGKLGLKAIRIPGSGTSASIRLTATCKDEKGYYVEVCRLAKVQVYTGFRPFVERMLKE